MALSSLAVFRTSSLPSIARRLAGLATIGAVVVACGAPAVDPESTSGATTAASDGAIPASSQTTEAIGVTEWKAATGDDKQLALTGYDAEGDVKARFSFARTVSAKGAKGVEIHRTLPVEAALAFEILDETHIVITKDTFRDQPKAQRALDNAMADASKGGKPKTDASLVATQVLHTLGGDLTNGNQPKLVCQTEDGDACEAPPDGGSTVRDCALGVAGLGGTACLATGAETIGVGCVVGAAVAVGGAVICIDDLHSRAKCKCVTACEYNCAQANNHQYSCGANNPQPCYDAEDRDRQKAADCIKACPAE